MNQLRLIKTLVFVFTFLLIFGCLTLVGCFFYNIRNHPKYVGSVDLELSNTAKIEQIASDNGILYILVSDADHADKIIVFNPEKNTIVSNLVANRGLR